MFCGFCGKKISSKEKVCPYCGQSQEDRKGGNGFWDLFSPQTDSDGANRDTVSQPPENTVEQLDPRKQPKDRKRKNSKKGNGFNCIVFALLILSILLEAVAFCGISSQKKTLQDMKKSLDTQQKTLDSLEEENRRISEFLGDITSTLTEIASTKPDTIDENTTEMLRETVPEEPSVPPETATLPAEETVGMEENGRNENETLPESGKSNELS